MRPDDWHFTDDAADFTARTGAFLRSRPALHTTMLTAVDRLRTHPAEAPHLGTLERDGEVRAVAIRRTPHGGVGTTPLTPEEADGLAVRLAGHGDPVTSVSAEHDSATAFADAWQRHTGATPALRVRINLYRLGTLTPPEPVPAGRARVAGEADREHLMRWMREFTEIVEEDVVITADTWADTRFGDKSFVYWETPDGTPVSVAGRTLLAGGQIRVDPVYTPAGLRGRGYAGAATVAVTRDALAAGAREVALYADPDNLTSNALYQRIGYEPLARWAVYDLARGTPA